MLNPVEPPRYVTRMPGGVGGAAAARRPPIPINMHNRISNYRIPRILVEESEDRISIAIVENSLVWPTL